MNITFNGKYKSIADFNWQNIPAFVVVTGPNGSGKSQLLNLIYNTIINKAGTTERLKIEGLDIGADEVTFLRGEWQLQSTSSINLAQLQSYKNSKYQDFRGNQHQFINIANFGRNEHNLNLYETYQKILKQTGKSNANQVTMEEFEALFPEDLIEEENQISQKIGELFYNYRLSEIELQAQHLPNEDILKKIGEKPWDVLRDIIKASRLPFDINDPSDKGFRDSFRLILTHRILNEEVNFSDLSSGEKVLVSLVFYLYNSQEKNIFPKLLLLDEPDAHLHPSMSQQFLNVIKNVLVDKYGVRVIMTTHSPSTVILAPEDSIFEMSRNEPRIKETRSKNHAVSLLTSGLVYVGKGTKYYLVEDTDDVDFYSYIYNQMISDNLINSDIPLVFIPASINIKSGGKDVVQGWVNKLNNSGLTGIISGLIDADSGNEIGNGIYKIDRYSIENYLADPIIVYVALMDKEVQPQIDGIVLTIGEEYKLKLLANDKLQKIVDTIIALVEPNISKCFGDFDSDVDNEPFLVSFIDGINLSYPKWLFSRRGKTIIHQLYNEVFNSTIINYKTLFKALRKLNLFPNELLVKFNELVSQVDNSETKSLVPSQD